MSTGFNGCASLTGSDVRPPVDLPRAGEDYLDLWIAGAACLQDRKLRTAIDFQVGHRIDHGIEVTRLSGQIEKVVFSANERLQTVSVAHVGDIDVQLVAKTFEVERIAAVLGNQAIDEGKVGPETNEPAGQVGADKAQTSRDQNLGSFELATHRRRFAYTSLRGSAPITSNADAAKAPQGSDPRIPAGIAGACARRFPDPPAPRRERRFP